MPLAVDDAVIWVSAVQSRLSVPSCFGFAGSDVVRGSTEADGTGSEVEVLSCACLKNRRRV